MISMPIRVICSKCGHVIYCGDDVIEPKDVVRNCRGRCPKCGKKLEEHPIKIDVYAKK